MLPLRTTLSLAAAPLALFAVPAMSADGGGKGLLATDVAAIEVASGDAYLGVYLGGPGQDGDAGPAHVSGVIDGSPAAAAGFRAGDVVVSLGDHAIGSIEDLHEALGGFAPGQEVQIGLDRGDERVVLALTLGSRTDAPGHVFEGGQDDVESGLEALERELGVDAEGAHAISFGAPSGGFFFEDAEPTDETFGEAEVLLEMGSSPGEVDARNELNESFEAFLKALHRYEDEAGGEHAEQAARLREIVADHMEGLAPRHEIRRVRLADSDALFVGGAPAAGEHDRGGAPAAGEHDGKEKKVKRAFKVKRSDGGDARKGVERRIRVFLDGQEHEHDGDHAERDVQVFRGDDGAEVEVEIRRSPARVFTTRVHPGDGGHEHDGRHELRGGVGIDVDLHEHVQEALRAHLGGGRARDAQVWVTDDGDGRCEECEHCEGEDVKVEREVRILDGGSGRWITRGDDDWFERHDEDDDHHAHEHDHDEDRWHRDDDGFGMRTRVHEGSPRRIEVRRMHPEGGASFLGGAGPMRGFRFRDDDHDGDAFEELRDELDELRSELRALRRSLRELHGERR